jgi:hypothetical protein
MGHRVLPAVLGPVGAVVVTAALLSAAGCAPSSCGGFALSQVDHGGQPTPVAAAEWFAAHSQSIATVPASGWQESSHDDAGVVLRSGGATLHAFQGPDQTWQVDGGKSC